MLSALFSPPPPPPLPPPPPCPSQSLAVRRRPSHLRALGPVSIVRNHSRRSPRCIPLSHPLFFSPHSSLDRRHPFSPGRKYRQLHSTSVLLNDSERAAGRDRKLFFVDIHFNPPLSSLSLSLSLLSPRGIFHPFAWVFTHESAGRSKIIFAGPFDRRFIGPSFS